MPAITPEPGGATPAPMPPPVTQSEPIDIKQKPALQSLLSAADSLSRSLSGDNLEQFKSESSRIPALVDAALAESQSMESLASSLKPIQAAAKWPVPADLAGARRSFLPFSSAVVELVQNVRGRDSALSALKVFHCPMAPKPGLWFQTNGPLRNPFFGAKMLSCGEEVTGAVAPPPLSAMEMDPESAVDPKPPVAESGGSQSARLRKANTRVRSGPMRGGDHDTFVRTMELRAAETAARGEASRNPEGARPPRSMAQHEALESFLAVADDLASALAASDLAQFNQHLLDLPDAVLPVMKELAQLPKISSQFAALRTFAELAPAKDLNEARQRFAPFSGAVVEIVKTLRVEDPDFASFKLFHCASSPKPGLWMQSRGPARNPFLGTGNGDCGEEIK